MIPLPKDPRHQRFADLRLRDKSLLDAYAGAGFKNDRRSSSNAKRIEKRADVQAYIAAIRAEAATASVLTVTEKREFFARIVRTPLTSIDPDNDKDPNLDLVKKIKRRYTVEDEVEKCTEEFEKLDPLKAIDLDNKLSGDDPEANALQSLAAAIAEIGHQTTALPQDRM